VFFPGDLTVVGERHHGAEIRRLLSDRAGGSLDHRCEAHLCREPDNAADPNAVAVVVHGVRVGYIAAECAERVGREVGHDEVVLKCIIRWDGEVDNGIYRVKLFPTI